jgi:hypothetical protein
MTDAAYETRFARPSQMEGCDTVYHLIPNPDAGSMTFNEGATLFWEEPDDGWKPRGHFFIPTEDLRAIGQMLLAAADIAEGVK